MEACGCFIENNNKIILLHRHENRPQGETWGLPSGKIHTKNIAYEMIREIQEETSIVLNKKQLKFFKKVFVRFPEYDFIYHIFHTKFESQPKIKINSQEHTDFCWATPKQALKMNLIEDLDKCIKLFYGL